MMKNFWPRCPENLSQFGQPLSLSHPVGNIKVFVRFVFVCSFEKKKNTEHFLLASTNQDRHQKQVPLHVLQPDVQCLRLQWESNLRSLTKKAHVVCEAWGWTGPVSIHNCESLESVSRTDESSVRDKHSSTVSFPSGSIEVHPTSEILSVWSTAGLMTAGSLVSPQLWLIVCPTQMCLYPNVFVSLVVFSFLLNCCPVSSEACIHCGGSWSPEGDI